MKFNGTVNDIVKKNELVDLLYPVGSIYRNRDNSNNPSTYLGGGLGIS